MSRFFQSRYQELVPYTPGEQPKDRKFVKLNTNESPFPPSALAQKMATEAACRLMLYPDPDCRELTRTISPILGIAEDEILWTNGSDDVLNFAFMAFCGKDRPALFPEITYGFYSVFAKAGNLPYETRPLKPDFSIDPKDYIDNGHTIFLANPNAPTGIALKRDQIEEILQKNPDCVVVIDEAYVDFGAESCVGLIHQYDNLLVTQTFSKSRSMAGARLGFAVGHRDLIADLNTLRYSSNPYSINTMTMAAGIGTLLDEAYTEKNCASVMANRDFTTSALSCLGFEMTPSLANFIFVRHPAISGEKLYLALRERGVLVRHFDNPKISDYNRISIGSREEMETLVKEIRSILEELL